VLLRTSPSPVLLTLDWIPGGQRGSDGRLLVSPAKTSRNRAPSPSKPPLFRVWKRKAR